MRRDRLLVSEMIEACDRIVALSDGRPPGEKGIDQLHLEALLWNFTVLGEAASQVSESLRNEAPHVDWLNPVRMRNRIVHG